MLERLNPMQSITPYYGRAIINDMLVGLVDRNEHALLTAGASAAGLDSLAAQLSRRCAAGCCGRRPLVP